MTTPEGVLTKQVTRYLKSREKDGLWWMKVHGGPSQKKGVPDIICVYRGQFFGWELKAPGKKVTKLQAHMMELMERGGARCRTVWDLVDVKLDLDIADERHKVYAAAVLGCQPENVVIS